MNVLFLTSTLPRFAGDMQPSFVLDQAHSWKAERPRDRVIILAPHDAGAKRTEKIGDVEVRRFRYFKPERWQQLAYPAILPNVKNNPVKALLILPFLIAEFFATLWVIKKQNVDFVYAHWVMPQGLTAYLLKVVLGVPYAIQNHSSDLEIFSKLGPPGRALARRIIRSSQGLFCVNKSQREFALNLFPRDERELLDQHITTLPMGVASDFLADDRSSYEKAQSFRYDLGTISRLSRKKGLPYFLNALEQLKLENMDVSVGIAGDGEDREALVNAAKSIDVDFTGYLQGANKSEFFQQTKIFVFTSVAAGSDVEGLPVSLLEALCLGKIVIASRDTNIEMLPEWDAIKSEIIFVADPSDIEAFKSAIREALSFSLDKLAARSQRIKAIMSRYGWTNLITEYQDTLGVSEQSGT